jgi:hypothetical protein
MTQDTDADAEPAERLDKRLHFHFEIGMEECPENKQQKRKKTLKTPILRCTGNKLRQNTFSEVQLEQA